MAKYKLLVCGGTFDLFHKGHKNFLNCALSNSDKILLGITSNRYINNFKNGLNIQDFNIRKKAAESYLNSIKALSKVKIVEINNAYEPYLESSPDYDAILVTPNTKKTALNINLKRKLNGLQKLNIITTPIQKAQDSLEISSTRIRNGEIDRNGKLCVNPEWKNKELILPQNLRSEFQKPWGKISNKIPLKIDPSTTIVVGDETAVNFNKNKLKQSLSIIDFKIRREERFKSVLQLGFKNEKVIKVKNPAGTISWQLIKVIQNYFRKKSKEIILIDGEDDLAVLPVILISPLNYSVFYGQPNVGMVEIKISEEIKEKAYEVLDSFDRKSNE